MSRLVWFSTENGRKCVGLLTVVTGTGLFMANFLPHTYLLNQYQEFVQMYRNGVPVPVCKKLLSKAESVVRDMNIAKEHQSLFKYFTPYGFDTFLAGSVRQNTGAIIGLPISFSYENVESINRSEIKVNNEDVNWSKEEAQNLLTSLVLSDDAQKFAIARQLHLSQNYHVVFNSIYAVAALISSYTVAYKLNRKLHLFQKPLVLRACFYTIIGLFGFGTWALLKDATTVYYEAEADKKSAQLGKNYLNGGIEFYDKILQRNISLRSLMGNRGQRYFTAYGNDEFLIRQYHAPYTVRKGTLLKLKEDTSVNKTESQIENKLSL